MQKEDNDNLLIKAEAYLKGKINENSNANIDEYSFSGREVSASAIVLKGLATRNMSPETRQAEKDGYIYEHDKDSFIAGKHNCLFIDFTEVLQTNKGFHTKNGDVREPKSFSVACQLVAVIFQCQSQCMFGGVGSQHIDYDLSKYVHLSFIKHLKNGLEYCNGLSDEEINNFIKINNPHLIEESKKAHNRVYKKAYEYAYKMLEEEGLQACESLYHNLNTLESRAGSQVPFTSINMGRDTSIEGRFITRWILQASMNGIGRCHKTSIFPISIFQVKKGTNSQQGDVNYDLKQLAIESLSKRIYPNFVNGDWSQANETPEDIDTYMATMGCRTLIGNDVNGLGYKKSGRGNNVPITMILPKLGIDFGICLEKREVADLDGFWRKFEEVLKVTELALIERFEIMAKQNPKSGYFMYKNGTIRGYKDCDTIVFNALKHNTLAFGYIGIAEMCEALFGKNHVHSKEVFDFALNVVKKINEFASECTAKHNLNFSCYATPAENLCYTAMNKLKSNYGIIKNVTEKEYLTNSHHVPVWEKVSIQEKLEIEAPFCKYPTGGCITYIELESTFINNPKAIEDIIDYAFSLDIPYLAFNFPIDTCLNCGYQSEIDNRCSICQSENIERLRRVTGYLTTDYSNFNKGKVAETLDRIKHGEIIDYSHL